MIYGYIRVSTAKQDVENQRHEILKYAESKSIVINQFTEETASGTKKASDRKLGDLLNTMKKGDTLIVSELSRLGRKLLNVMSTLNLCMERGIKLIAIKGGYELGDNIQSKVLAFAFSIAAEIERDLISMRTKEGLSRKRSEGVILGRKKGRLSDTYKLTEKEPLIRSEMAKNTSFRSIAKLAGVDRRTVKRFADKLLINK
jgi:DNA invertase Pin-like site-specific DNA recombinase